MKTKTYTEARAELMALITLLPTTGHNVSKASHWDYHNGGSTVGWFDVAISKEQYISVLKTLGDMGLHAWGYYSDTTVWPESPTIFVNLQTPSGKKIMYFPEVVQPTEFIDG